MTRALVPILLLLVAACQATGETPPAPSSPTGGSGLPDPTQASASPSGSGDVPAPIPGEPLTEEHSGATVELAGDESATVQLSSEWSWDIGDQVGDSVEAVPVNFAQDPGYYEWEIQPGAAGDTAIHFIGSSNCGDTVVCPPREVEFRFVVTD